ncbi:glycine cleavage system protein GcvH, partial [Desulfobacterales bacterium HSG17]|nr:glycine cleavage system protein GcvH [Desulfobacterales bacterium HSG17]
YSEEHEWAKMEDNLVRIGINDYAQDQLGDIVFVELPQVGDSFETGQEFGSVESVKAVSELFIPIAGEIVEVNAGLEDDPEKVNTDPYGEGWMVLIKPADATEIENMLTKDAYVATLKKE